MRIRNKLISKTSFSRAGLVLLSLLLPLSFVGHADNAAAVVNLAQSSAAAPMVPIQPTDEMNDGKMKEKPRVVDLGREKFRIGSIQIDKAKHLITIPGVMLPHEDGKLIEFLATMKQGYKSYESVMSLDANAFEFNLACILIGLDSKNAVSSKYHFDKNPVQGDPVSIKVGWKKDGEQFEYNAIDMLKIGERKTSKPSVWSYTGSMFDNDAYLAQMSGVLIGLIHDPASIIEHKEWLSIEKWGGITVNADVAPGNGHAIYIKIQRID